MEVFDYSKAIEELEMLALKVEDPSTGLDDIEAYIKRSDELVNKCKEYLRSMRLQITKINNQ